MDWVLESPFKANCGKLLHEGIAHKQLPGGLFSQSDDFKKTISDFFVAFGMTPIYLKNWWAYFRGIIGAWMTFKKVEMKKIHRNGLSLRETDPPNHKQLDFVIYLGLALQQFKKTVVKRQGVSNETSPWNTYFTSVWKMKYNLIKT